MDTMQLKGNILFRGLDEGDIAEALRLLDSSEKSYAKGDTILHAGSAASRMGMVLEGSVTVESGDIWGSRTILSHVGAGQVFAESYALLPAEPMLVDVTANESCRILFIRVSALPAVERKWSARLLSNLLIISAHKNLHLSGRSFHTSHRTIRARVMSYLSSVSIKTGRREFRIPFDRQQLADYLCVERTALSKELGRMQREGYIAFSKNRFTLLRADTDDAF